MQSHNSLTVEWRSVDRVIPYGRNPRIIPETAIAKVAASIEQFGWRQPIVVDAKGVVLVGHTRLLAAKRLKLEEVPVHVAKGLTPAQAAAYRLADNKVGEDTSWDMAALDLELADLKGFHLAPLGFELATLAPEGAKGVTLMDRFGVAPFTVLNAGTGWWQDRKRAWLALGIQSELGRGDSALGFSETVLRAGGRS
jgi:ParB-like chromosome segregation protein Spo0J